MVVFAGGSCLRCDRPYGYGKPGAYWASRASGGGLDIHHYFALWPALGVFFAIFAASSLYPGIIHNAVTELRRLGLGLTISFLVMEGLIVVTRSADDYPRRVLLLWWLMAVIVTPLLRSVVRELVCHKPWWGMPIAVFYTGVESADIIRELEMHPEIGLRPVVILSFSSCGPAPASLAGDRYAICCGGRGPAEWTAR